MLIPRPRIVLTLCLLLLGLASGWPARSAAPEDVRLFWPPPPHAPRMEFVGIVESEANLQVKWQDAVSSDQAITPNLDKLNYPAAVAVRPDGKLLVAEALGKTVKQINFERMPGTPGIRDLFEGSKPFREPADIAISPSDHIYLVDREGARVLVFDQEMQPLYRLEADIPFETPEKLAINRQSRIVYVSDSTLNRVFAFDAQGQPLFVFGNSEDEQARLLTPHGIAIDPQGNLYIADTGHAHIKIYDSAGHFQSTFPFDRGGSFELLAPWDLAFDSKGNLHILDQQLAAFVTCRTDGRILYATGASERTNHLLGFNRAVDIEIDRHDRVYIADDENKRIAIWQLFTEEYLAANPIDNQDIENLLSYRDYLKKHLGQQYFVRQDIKKRRDELQSSVVGFKLHKPVERHIIGQKVVHCPMCDNLNRVFIEKEDVDLLLDYAANLDNLKSERQILLGQRVVQCSFCSSDIHIAITYKGSSGQITLSQEPSGNNLSQHRQVPTAPQPATTASSPVAGI